MMFKKPYILSLFLLFCLSVHLSSFLFVFRLFSFSSVDLFFLVCQFLSDFFIFVYNFRRFCPSICSCFKTNYLKMLKRTIWPCTVLYLAPCCLLLIDPRLCQSVGPFVFDETNESYFCKKAHVDVCGRIAYSRDACFQGHLLT